MTMLQRISRFAAGHRFPRVVALRCFSFCCFLGIAGSVAYASPPEVAVSDSDEPKVTVRVLAIGDSHTAGWVSGRAGPSFIEILRKTLGPKFEIVNLGCNGSSVLDWTVPEIYIKACSIAGAYDLLAASQTPADIATVLLGTNDAVGFFQGHCGTALNPETKCPLSAVFYKERMTLLINRLVADGVPRIILLKPPKIKAVAAEATDRLRAYGVAIEEICTAQSHVTCGPDLFELLNVNRHFARGAIHANAAGHRKIAKALAPVVRSVAETILRASPSKSSR